MRIGGVFPFGELGTAISLGGGGTFYPPAGNYVLGLGRVSVLQWWDNVTNIWRNLAGPSTYTKVDVDGTNWRIVNFSGIASGALITNAGSAATNGIGTTATGVTVSFGAAPTNGRAAAAYPIVGGSINSTVTITAAGSGYLVPPHIAFDPPPTGGIKATGHVTSLTATGGINGVTVDNVGAGYLTAPNITIANQVQFYSGAPSGGAATPSYPPAGSGAVLTVNPTLSGSGTLTGLVMTDYGAGYAGTTIPTITLGGTLTSGAATAIMALSMTGTSSLSGGAGYSGTAPIFESSLGLVAATDSNNGVYLPRAARGVTTISGSAVATVVIEDPGFALQKVPSLAFINVGSIASGQATATAVVGGIQDTSVLQPAINV